MGRLWVNGEDGSAPSVSRSTAQLGDKDASPHRGRPERRERLGTALDCPLRGRPLTPPNGVLELGTEPPVGHHWDKVLWWGVQNGFSPREKQTLPPDTLPQALSSDILVLLYDHRKQPGGRTPGFMVLFLASWLSTKTLESGNPD